MPAIPRSSRRRVFAVAGDVGEPATARAVIAAAREQLGGIDMLVNNAGIFGVKPFLDSTIEDLERRAAGPRNGSP